MTNVYFTVDTESSMGGAWNDPARRPVPAERHVFCRIGAREYGVPLLVDLLGRYGQRATFFVETMATRCLGAGDTRSIFDFLLRHGQDVQLHIHPTYRYYAESRQAAADGVEYNRPRPDDLLGSFPKPVQLDLLGEAIRHFEDAAGFRPSAFRAGSYAAGRATLQCLAEVGIAVDSSFNPCYPAVSFPGETLQPNQTQKLDGVWEIPVTVARSPLPEVHRRLKFADCSSMAFPELKTILDSAAAAGHEHFVMVFHSFSTVKTRDVSYLEMRPNRIVIRRLEKLLRYLAENPARFRVATMGEAARSLSRRVSPAPAIIPDLGLFHAAVRKGVQLLNGSYWI